MSNIPPHRRAHEPPGEQPEAAPPQGGHGPEHGSYPPPQRSDEFTSGGKAPAQGSYPPPQGASRAHQPAPYGTIQPPTGSNPHGNQPAPYGTIQPPTGSNPHGNQPAPYGNFQPPPTSPGHHQLGSEGGGKPRRTKRWLLIAVGLIILAALALMWMPNLLGNKSELATPSESELATASESELATASESELAAPSEGVQHSQDWLNEPSTIWEMDNVLGMVGTSGAKYLTVITESSVQVLDAASGKREFTIDQLRPETMQKQRLTQFDDDVLFNANAGPGAGSYALQTGERSATPEFIAATERDDYRWYESATWTELDKAGDGVNVEYYDRHSTERKYACTLDQQPSKIVKLSVHFNGESAMIERENYAVEFVELATCKTTPIQSRTSDKNAGSDGKIAMTRLHPTTDGWWSAGPRSWDDQWESMHISFTGNLTPAETFATSPQHIDPGLPFQRFRAADLDTANRCGADLESAVVFFEQNAGKLHAWATSPATPGKYQHCLDGKPVAGFDQPGLFIADFDHLLTFGDGQVAHVSAAPASTLWSMPGSGIVPLGEYMAVYSQDARTLTGLKPGK